MSEIRNTITRILRRLTQEVSYWVNKNSQTADDFHQKLYTCLPRSPTGCFTISFQHSGSAYENLAVSKDADFDIGVILGDNFAGENFTAKRDPSGFYTLEWKTHLHSKPFADCNDFLDAGKICQGVFDCLIRGINNVSIPGTRIKCSRGLCAVQVQIEFSQERIVNIDLVPQIVFRTWGQCPEMRSLDELPRSLRCFIDTLNRNRSPVMALTMAVPGARRFPNSDQLFSPSFSFLEKKFLTDNDDLRGMVRLGKLVAEQRNWKQRFFFKALYIKRAAVKYCDQLKGKYEWEGLRCLLDYFSQDVRRGYVDGFFIKDEKLYEWQPQMAEDLLREIAVVRDMDPRSIERIM